MRKFKSSGYKQFFVFVFAISFTSLFITQGWTATFFGENPGPGIHEYSFKNARYLVYLPPGYEINQSYPLVILSYISEGNQELDPDFYFQSWVKEAEARGFIVVLPLVGGIFEKLDSWFEDFMKYLKLQYPADRSQVLLTGYGEGAHYALHYGLGHPHDFGALSLAEGAFEGPWKPLMIFKRGDKQRFYFLSGANDTKVPSAEIQQAAEKAKSKGHEVVFEEMPGTDHRYLPEMTRKAADWFEGRSPAEKPSKPAETQAEEEKPESKSEVPQEAEKIGNAGGFNGDLQRAYTAAVLGRRDIAYPLFKKLLSAHPKEWIVYDAYTQVLEMNRSFAAARKVYQEALPQIPARAEEIKIHLDNLSRMETFQQEMKSAPPWSEAKVFGSNFCIIQSNVPETYFRPIHDKITRFFEGEREILKKIFGVSGQSKRSLKVLVFGRAEEFAHLLELAGKKYFATAYYEPSTATLAILFTGKEDWEAVAHELGHALLHEGYLGNPSKFLDEGLATYLGFKMAREDIRGKLISDLEYLNWLDSQGELEHATKIFEVWKDYRRSGWDDTPMSRKHDFYLISWSLIHFFVETKDFFYKDFFNQYLEFERKYPGGGPEEIQNYFLNYLSEDQRKDLDLQWGKHFLELTPESV